jgi:hypothetical protein
MLWSRNVDAGAAERLAEESKRPHGPLVQLGIDVKVRQSETVTAA